MPLLSLSAASLGGGLHFGKLKLYSLKRFLSRKAWPKVEIYEAVGKKLDYEGDSTLHHA